MPGVQSWPLQTLLSHCPMPRAHQYSLFLSAQELVLSQLLFFFFPFSFFPFFLFRFLNIQDFNPPFSTAHRINVRNSLTPEARFCYVNYSSPSSCGAAWSSAHGSSPCGKHHRHCAVLSQAAAPKATQRNQVFFMSKINWKKQYLPQWLPQVKALDAFCGRSLRWFDL